MEMSSKRWADWNVTFTVEDLAIEGPCGDACALREIPVVTITVEMEHLLRVFKKNPSSLLSP
jgi:hypothetical protein